MMLAFGDIVVLCGEYPVKMDSCNIYEPGEKFVVLGESPPNLTGWSEAIDGHYKVHRDYAAVSLLAPDGRIVKGVYKHTSVLRKIA